MNALPLLLLFLNAAEPDAAAIAAMLPEHPAGLGRSITDRAAWARLAATRAYSGTVRGAEGLLKQPIPDSPDDLYLDFSKTGNRTRWQRVASRRRRVPAFVLAECIEGKGRFLRPLAETVAALCAERTWVMPAHDRSLANFKGSSIDIDLGSSHLGANLAMAAWLLGDRLDATTRTLIRDNLQRRIITPYLDMVAGKRKKNWWMRCTNNWNAVCLANVTVVGLAALESREQRAAFVASAREHSRNFLRGFTPDGYCSEGVGYWNYGYGYFLLLSEAIHQATRGGVDLLGQPAARAPATFATRIEIANGVYPAFADCSVGSRPSGRARHFIARRFGLGADPAADASLVSPSGDLAVAMMYSFPNSATAAPPPEKPSPPLGPRDWFDHAGILICRPADAADCRMAVALKGGHNAEHHNHNDVGSYVVVIGETPVLVDPGAEVYTARTFSSQRYESKVLNSFGHPVPRVAGQLQRPGRKAQARVARTDFTPQADTLELDLRAAYNVPSLKALTRTFTYSRQGAGSLTVADTVAFASPQAFETALITLGKWKRPDPATLVVYDFDQAVRVRITAEGAPFDVQAETIREDVRTRTLPTRLGIRLAKPVAAATITMHIEPYTDPGEANSGLLRNGGFELDDWCWRIPAKGMGTITADRAATGTRSLKLADPSTETGSNISSARIPIAAPGAFELRGKVFRVSGDGVGLYIKYYDAARRLLNPVNARGHIQGVGSLGGAEGRWEDFAFPFTAPAHTANLEVWIHTYNAAQVEACLDDLEIRPRP